MMRLTLTTGTSYNTDKAEKRNRLKSNVARLSQTRRAEEKAHLKKQIEQAQIVSKKDIVLYNHFGGEAETKQFKQAHIPSNPKGNQFTFIKGSFYQLIDSKAGEEDADENSLLYTLITSLLYENQRHDWNKQPCLRLRQAINKFLPHSFTKSRDYFERYIAKREKNTGDYYGLYLSDDSDSDQEAAFQEFSIAKRTKIAKRAATYANRAERYRYYNNIQHGLEAPTKNHYDGPTIYRRHPEREARAEKDLKKINKQLADYGTLPEEFLKGLKTKFLAAQYRGVHYNTSGWGADERRKHRDLPEIGLPQFSGAARSACDIDSFYKFVEIITAKDQRYEALLQAAESIEEKLIKMQSTGPVSYSGRVYISLFHLLQYWYSSDYAGLPRKIKDDFKKGSSSNLKPFLENSGRPLLSTGDTPWHALRYAYGAKYYDGQKDVRLRPRWQKDGRAERPKVGKVYVSLHPLSDYTEHRPSHITSMYNAGLIFLNSQISPERETSFLGGLPADRVFHQHIAKYPSFKHDGQYKEIYLHKYGIDEALYKAIKAKLAASKPHTPERKNLKVALGEYLCAYQEARLIAKAESEASSRGAILIYRNKDGGFSLVHPPTPTVASNTYKDVVNAKTALYKELASELGANKKPEVTVLYGYKSQVREAITEQDDNYLPVQRDAWRLLADDGLTDGELSDTESEASTATASTLASEDTEPYGSSSKNPPKAKRKLKL